MAPLLDQILPPLLGPDPLPTRRKLAIEVVPGKCPHFAGGIHPRRRAIGRHGLAGKGIGFYGLHDLFIQCPELFIRFGGQLHIIWIVRMFNYHSFQPLAPHHRAHAAPGRRPARQARIHLRHHDGGDKAQVLSSRTDGGNGDPVIICFAKRLAHRIGVHAHIGCRVYQAGVPLFIDVEINPVWGLPFKQDDLNLVIRHAAGKGAAGVGFFNAPGQRALCADGKPVAGG